MISKRSRESVVLGTMLESYSGGRNVFLAGEVTSNLRERPKKYWKDRKNLDRELKNVIRKLGHFPSVDELRESGLSSVAMAASKYHGGLTSIKQELGYTHQQRPKNYWDKEVVLEEAKKIKRKHKFKALPGGTTLRKLGYNAFTQAVHKYYGGMNALRKPLGEEVTRIDSSKIQNRRYIIQEARRIMEKEDLEELPGWQELYRLGYASFTNAVNRHHGGIPSIRKSLGQRNGKKPNGYWSNWENAGPVLKKMIQRVGHFPTQQELQKEKLGSLANSITHAFGGANAVRKRLGIEIEIKYKGY